MGVDVADHEAAAMEEQYHRTRLAPFAWVEAPRGDRPSRAVDRERLVKPERPDRRIGQVARGAHHLAGGLGTQFLLGRAGETVVIAEEARHVGA